MKGTTHLAIGAAIGVGASLYFPLSAENAVLYVAVASFSALSADLDGTGMLSSKLGPAAKMLRTLLIWAGLLLVAGTAYLYVAQDRFYPIYAIVSVVVLLFGFISRTGAIRNALVSAIGCALLYAGWTYGLKWLMGFGLFVGWVPWLNHRGLTHTIWAVVAWGAIGYGLESQLQVEGITRVAVAGYLSHLLADTMTPSGVKWLYPLYGKTFKFPL